MRIQLAVPWTDDKGVDHRAGTKLQVIPDVGYQLIKDGFAAAAGAVEDPPEPPEPPKEPADPAQTTTSPSPGDTVKGTGYGRS